MDSKLPTYAEWPKDCRDVETIELWLEAAGVEIHRVDCSDEQESRELLAEWVRDWLDSMDDDVADEGMGSEWITQPFEGWCATQLGTMTCDQAMWQLDADSLRAAAGIVDALSILGTWAGDWTDYLQWTGRNAGRRRAVRPLLTRPLDSQLKVCFTGHQEPDQTKEDPMPTTTATQTLEQRIASKWTDYQIGKALAVIAVPNNSWTPAMKQAVRDEAVRRLTEGGE